MKNVLIWRKCVWHLLHKYIVEYFFMAQSNDVDDKADAYDDDDDGIFRFFLLSKPLFFFIAN